MPHGFAVVFRQQKPKGEGGGNL